MDRVTLNLRRLRWVDEFVDTHPDIEFDGYGQKRAEIDASPEWQRIQRQTRSAFGGRCYANGCNQTTWLDTAHIDYPETGPGTERIDPDNLWESDIVLLCRYHHYMLDGDTKRMEFHDVPSLRAAVIRLIGRMGED